MDGMEAAKNVMMMLIWPAGYNIAIATTVALGSFNYGYDHGTITRP